MTSGVPGSSVILGFDDRYHWAEQEEMRFGIPEHHLCD